MRLKSFEMLKVLLENVVVVDVGLVGFTKQA